MNKIFRNLLFLYLIDVVEFGQDILQGCVSSYYLYAYFFLMNLDDPFSVVCMGFHEVVVSTRYVPLTDNTHLTYLHADHKHNAVFVWLWPMASADLL